MIVPAASQPSPLPSSEELTGLFGVLTNRVDALETDNAGLRGENAELRRRLGMNSLLTAQPAPQFPDLRGQRHLTTRRRPCASSPKPGHPTSGGLNNLPSKVGTSVAFWGYSSR